VVDEAQPAVLDPPLDLLVAEAELDQLLA